MGCSGRHAFVEDLWRWNRALADYLANLIDIVCDWWFGILGRNEDLGSA